jgi:hypothetical protein
MVARDRIELPTRGFSVVKSNRKSILIIDLVAQLSVVGNSLESVT